MSIQNVLRLLQPTEHIVRASASAAAWWGFTAFTILDSAI